VGSFKRIQVACDTPCRNSLISFENHRVHWKSVSKKSWNQYSLITLRMPYLSTSGQLGESWTFKSWGLKTYVFESWTFNSVDLLKYGMRATIDVSR
jgi:hypothetical protein